MTYLTIAASPTSGDKNTSFKFAVTYAVAGATCDLKIHKGWTYDPKLGERNGDGFISFSGNEIISKAKLPPGTHDVVIYVEEHTWRYTPNRKAYVTIRVKVPDTDVSGDVFGMTVTPTYGKPDTEFTFKVTGVKTGDTCYIRGEKAGFNPTLRTIYGSQTFKLKGSEIISKLGLKEGRNSGVNIYAEYAKWATNPRRHVSLTIDVPKAVVFGMTVTPSYGKPDTEFTFKVTGVKTGDTCYIRGEKAGFNPTLRTIYGSQTFKLKGSEIISKLGLKEGRNSGVDIYAEYAKLTINPRRHVSLTIDVPKEVVSEDKIPTPPWEDDEEVVSEDKIPTPPWEDDEEVVTDEFIPPWEDEGIIPPWDDEFIPPWEDEGIIPPWDDEFIPPLDEEGIVVTEEEADAGIKAGKQYHLKCVLPLFSMLPGLPYISGFPIPPGFVITEKP